MFTKRRVWLLIAALVGVVALAGCDWPQFAFDAGNSNFDPGEPALTPASVSHLGTVWTKACSCGRPLVVGDEVFVVDGLSQSQVPFNATVRWFQTSTGIQGWSTPIGTVTGATLDAVGNGVVYLTVHRVTGSDEVIGLDQASGNVDFTITPPAPGNQPVHLGVETTLDGPLLFVVARAGTNDEVSAINPSGHVVWSVQPGGSVNGLSADAGHTLYASSVIALTSPPDTFVPLLTGYAETNGGRVSAVVVGGRPTTNFSPLTAFQGGLSYGADTSLHGGRGAGAIAVDPANGTVVPLTGGDFLTAVSPTAAILVDQQNDVSAVNPKTGAQLWFHFFSGPDATPEAIAGNLVYVAAGTNIVMLNLASGTVAATSPTLADGVSWITPSGGRIFSVGTTTLTALAPT